MNDLARRTGRFPQLVDPRSSVNGLLLAGSPRFREVSLEERRSLAGQAVYDLIHFKILLSPPSAPRSSTAFVARIDGFSEERQRFSRLRDDVLVNGMLTQIGHFGPREASA